MRLANYLYETHTAFIKMPPSFIDMLRVHDGNRLNQERSQSSVLAGANPSALKTRVRHFIA
jgi:hypothetical protein